MANTYTAVMKQDEGWWTGWIEEVPGVNRQERTRGELLRHLRQHGCMFIREGGSHSWWGNPAQNRRPSIPRHTEVQDNLARKICKDLGIAFVR